MIMPQYPSRKQLITEGKKLGVYNLNNKLCLLVGSSPSFLKDFENFKAKFPHIPFHVIAVNKALIHIEKVDHWCSRHPASITDAKWREQRLDKGWQNNFKTHTSIWRMKPESLWVKHIDHIWKVYVRRGSSALFGVGCAMGMGYNGVVLCGVELTRMYQRYKREFKMFNRTFPNYIKSQSGYLSHRNILGEPTESWLGKIIN